ncbi:MAG: hypothetical protein AB7O21_07095 [Gammaproteobacteria bacterium]
MRLSPAFRIGAVILGALTAALLFALACRRDAIGLLADGYIYLLMAEALRSPDVAVPSWRWLAGQYPFPPLYPGVLAAVGAGPLALMPALAVNTGLLGTSAALTMCWYRRLGIPRAPAFAIAAIWTTLPVTLLTALDVQSEPLYLALSLGALLVLAAEPPPGAHGRWILAGVLCAAAGLTRTAGLSLLFAFSIAWVARGRRAGLLPLACGWLPVLAWQAGRHLMSLDASYSDNALGAAGTTATALVARAATMVDAMVYYAPRSFDLGAGWHVGIGVAVLAGLAAGTLLARLRRLEADAVYVAAYVVMILLWPYPHHARRFLFVLLPVLFGYALIGLAHGAQRFPRPSRQWILLALPSLVLLFTWPSTTLMVAEIRRGGEGVAASVARSPARYHVASPHAALVQEEAFAPVRALLTRAATRLPADACVMSPIPEVTMFHLRREVRDMARHRKDPAAALRDCPYVLMVAFRNFPDNGLPPMFPYERLRDSLRVIDAAESEVGNGRRTVRALLARHGEPVNP